MPKPFYNSTDAALASGANNVVEIVTPTPAVYGLLATQVASYTTLAENYTTLLALATTPATRTPVAIEEKNAARTLLKSASLNLAKIITATTTVTNAQLLALRMNERVIPTPRAVPAIPPVMEVDSVSGRLVNIRVHEAGSDRRGLPFGAIGANIYSFVGTEAPSDPREYHFEGMATRAKAQILFPDTVASGATIWLSASWVSARGQTSIGSTPISFALQGGAIPAAV